MRWAPSFGRHSVNAWIRLGRVRKSPQVSVLRSFKNNGLGRQIRRGRPMGLNP